MKRLEILIVFCSILVLLILVGDVLYVRVMNQQGQMDRSHPSSEPYITSTQSPLPTSLPFPTDTPAISSVAGQITYHSFGRYSITVPNSWTVNQYGNPPDNPTPNTNMDILPPNEPGIPSEIMGIQGGANTIAINDWQQELVTSTTYKQNNWLADYKMYTMQVGGLPATVIRYVWKPTPPAHFAGEWYDNTEKYVYIPAGRNTLFISMQWSNAHPEYEKIFNAIVTTLTFDQ